MRVRAGEVAPGAELISALSTVEQSHLVEVDLALGVVPPDVGHHGRAARIVQLQHSGQMRIRQDPQHAPNQNTSASATPIMSAVNSIAQHATGAVIKSSGCSMRPSSQAAAHREVVNDSEPGAQTRTAECPRTLFTFHAAAHREVVDDGEPGAQLRQQGPRLQRRDVARLHTHVKSVTVTHATSVGNSSALCRGQTTGASPSRAWKRESEGTFEKAHVQQELGLVAERAEVGDGTHVLQDEQVGAARQVPQAVGHCCVTCAKNRKASSY